MSEDEEYFFYTYTLLSHFRIFRGQFTIYILSNFFYNNFLGRAVMIGAIEKQKLVYILNRDAQARLTISSPLEAHKANTFVYHCVGVDVGFENPMFACLEVDYEEVDNDPSGIHYLKIFHMNFSFLNYT